MFSTTQAMGEDSFHDTEWIGDEIKGKKSNQSDQIQQLLQVVGAGSVLIE